MAGLLAGLRLEGKGGAKEGEEEEEEGTGVSLVEEVLGLGTGRTGGVSTGAETGT